MILRRVIEHFRKQEWTAIFLDFLIVVVGVLMAFQITAWKDARAMKAREIVFLERLSQDFARIIENGEANSITMESHPQLTGRLIARIRAGTAPAVDEAFFAEVKAATIVPAPIEKSPTYQEMIATGTLSLISSAQVRGLLSEFAAARENDNSVTDQLSRLVDEGAIDAGVRFRLTADTASGYFEGESIDWPKLQAAAPQLQVIMRKQLLLTIWKGQSVGSAKKAAAAIDAELERRR